MARILLTGATGFVGGALLRRLVADGHEVVALSGWRGAKAQAAGAAWRRLDLLQATEADIAELVAAERVSVCVHAAWYTNHSDYLVSEANRDWAEGTLRLERAFRSGGGRRFIGLGTCIEYDLRQGGRCSEELTPLWPDTAYGAAKADTFRRLMEQSATSGGDFAWARLFFIYGPGDRAGRLLPYILSRLSAGQAVSAKAGGLRRDYIHVDDLAGQLARIALSDVRGAINTGTGSAVKIADIFRTAGELAGRPELVETSEALLPGQPDSIEADLTRFRSLIGDPCVRPLLEGLAALLTGSTRPAAEQL
jgi:nucleoside-diphosphate-sugar epimerase